MADKTTDKKKLTMGQWHFWGAAVAIGIALLVMVFISSTKTDMDSTRYALSDTVNYIKKQCATYSSLNLASETKSLMRIMESAQQIDRDICQAEAMNPNVDIDVKLLEEYARQHYLTGIMLLDSNGKVEAQYCDSDVELIDFQEEFRKDPIWDVVTRPEKTYSARISCKDGSYIDMAAYGRKDKPGIIVTYYHTPLEYVQSYNLSFQNLLSGYSIERAGTIVVTRGDQIIASNDESLAGCSIDDIPVLQNIKQKAVNGKMVHVKAQREGPYISFGVLDRGRDYYIFAYIPEREVFDATPRHLLYAVAGYAFAIVIVILVRGKTARLYNEKQLQQEKNYQEKLKEAARKAESANLAKTEFLQRMSHDIRTPINGIRGMIEIANYHSDDMQKQEECREKIWEASGLLLELVNEVLDMGKLESGEIVLESREFSVLSVVDEICKVLEKQASERGIQIILETPSVKHPYVVGSPLHVKRLLMNIVSNAVKYNKDKGSVTLACREKQCEGEKVWIEFVCADTGIGMSPEFQKHLFEPFTQENSEARSTYEGTGLGMSITKNLVDKMGGTITFESEQGLGTTYYITIPFTVAADTVLKTAKITQQPSFSMKGLHILLAEDNDLNMEIAVFLLEHAGAIVTKANNGQEAVEIFGQSQTGEFDAIIMDIMMPIMDGHEATRTIRAMVREDAKTIPIIAMTANAFADDRLKAYEAGMNEHLAKPLDTNDVLRVLEKYCRK